MRNFFKPAVDLINRLKYSQKLTLLGSIVVFIVIILAHQIIEQSMAIITFTKKELRGLEFNVPVVSVFEKIQEYRYLENRYQLGENTLGSEVSTLRDDIDNSIEFADAQINELATEFHVSNDWIKIKNKWENIKEEKNKSSIFSESTDLLDKIRVLMIDVCDVSNLTLDPELDSVYLMDCYCTELPRMTEHTALIRDIGITALVNKKISAGDRDELVVLRALLLNFDVTTVQTELEKAMRSNPDLSPVIYPLTHSLYSEASDSGRMLETTVLSGNFNVTIQDYAKQFNSLLDVTYQLNGQAETSLAEILKKRVNSAYRVLIVNITIASVALIFFIYLFIGIYISIMRGIKKLVVASEQIGKGNLAVKVELDTRDELSQIASSFNDMSILLSNVVNEIHDVVIDATNGILNKRLDLSGREGFSRELFSDINKMSTVFNDVVIDITRVLGFVSKGDLSHKITNDYRGMFGELKIYVNESIESLETLIKAVKSSTATISHAAKEIALGNNDLAKRTDQQAASLEETSVSMKKLTSTVKQNTENAQGVSNLAQTVSATATTGGTVVNQVVDMMNNINEGIRQVEDISNVINSIAFQTNILALNAAVEAARAGEHGRGFSVVATEIRNLAQRSSVSSKEIKNLIDATVVKILNGTKLVDSAGQTMNEVVNGVSGVAGIMSQIAEASVVQSSGIEQINMAINQIDQVTQQNSALVEEAARASLSLEQQTKHMNELVGVFKLTGSDNDNSPQKNRFKEAKNEIGEAQEDFSGNENDDEWKEF